MSKPAVDKATRPDADQNDPVTPEVEQILRAGSRSALAALDLQQARDRFDAREPGLGDTFLDRVNETIAKISENPEQYQIALADLHRAPIPKHRWSVFYRILPDESIVVASLSDRREPSAAVAAAFFGCDNARFAEQVGVDSRCDCGLHAACSAIEVQHYPSRAG
jgi:hypothetical protein